MSKTKCKAELVWDLVNAVDSYLDSTADVGSQEDDDHICEMIEALDAFHANPIKIPLQPRNYYARKKERTNGK
jgi:hypothetical protein